jgi:hypothetical protein
MHSSHAVKLMHLIYDGPGVDKDYLKVKWLSRVRSGMVVPAVYVRRTNVIRRW